MTRSTTPAHPPGHGTTPAAHGTAHPPAAGGAHGHAAHGHGAGHATHGHGHHHDDSAPKWVKALMVLVPAVLVTVFLYADQLSFQLYLADGTLDRESIGNWLVLVLGWPAVVYSLWFIFIKKAGH